ncbi:MAG: DUF433 domain-containing protein [Candidatus Nanoarchaeia archaeon]|nr:DUF433 domain-containing protein [Candidatus Nanoarchaeia archaeon]
MAETNGKLIVKIPGYCGGAAKVRSMSLPVSTIVAMHNLGDSLEAIVTAYSPPLTMEEAKAAIAYYNASKENKEEIDREIYEFSRPPKGYRVGPHGILTKK